MFIDTNILFTKGGISKKYKKGEFIFHEGDHARFYHQIILGTKKILNTNFDGKEFTQAEFKNGESFGEPPLFIDVLYPSAALATENSTILKISKKKFMEILDEYPMLQKKVITWLARSIYNKTITTKETINSSPENRILAFLNYYKKKNNFEGIEIEIAYTRQEIANYTGLRVETIIRTLGKRQTKNHVKIINRKLIF